VTLHQWAMTHSIPPAALNDLIYLLQAPANVAAVDTGESEAAVQQAIRLEAPRHGERLFRNNNGACVDENGNFIRYGIANDSKAMNEKIKSSDLIGIKPVVITPDLLGETLGVFKAVECKPAGWVYKATKREQAQLAFGQLVISLGGRFTFAQNPSDVWS